MTQLTAQILEQLLDKNGIQARLNARRPPPCPSSWKASFMERTLGKDAPWGDFDLAWTLLRMGKTEEGRELLRRLCKHNPRDRDNLALGAFELLREPADRTGSSRLFEELWRFFPDACEFHALRTIGLFDRNPKLAYESYCKNDGKHSGTFGTFLNDLQDVFVSDIHHQVIFCRVGTTIDSVIIQPVVKGVAAFLLRRQQEAFSMFARGYREADQIGAYYVRNLGITLTQAQHESLAGMIQLVSLKGLYLTLFDFGLDDLAKRVEELLEKEKLLLRDVIVGGIVKA